MEDRRPVTVFLVEQRRRLPAATVGERSLPSVEKLLQALREFESSMRVEPNRFRGLAGAARAAELAGDRTKAQAYSTQLAALGEKADSERPELVRAKAFLGK